MLAVLLGRPLATAEGAGADRRRRGRDRLIPLFAVGAFAAFTSSQAGMVVRWVRRRGMAGGGLVRACGDRISVLRVPRTSPARA